MDASSVPAGIAESDLSAPLIPAPIQGTVIIPPAVLSGRAAHELSNWGWSTVTVRGRTRGQIQPL